MKKTTIILLLIFIVLGSVTAWYFATNSGETKGTYQTSAMDFAIDSDLLHKIFLSDRTGNKTTILRKGDEWLVDGDKKMRPSTIKLLLEAIEEVKVKYRPTKSSYPSVTKDLATYGIEVELYGKENELLRNYYVGGVDQDGAGTFMIMAEEDEIFVTHVATHVGGLRTRFAMSADEWRDRSVFAEKPEDIISVSVEYPLQKNKSFKLSRDGSRFKVEPFFKTTPIIATNVIKGKPEKFLQSFKSKIAEAFQNEYTLKDFAKTVDPFAILSLTKKDGTEKTVRFIPFQQTGKNGELIKQDPNGKVFRYHADCSWGDFMLVQQRVVGDLFWSYEAFYK